MNLAYSWLAPNTGDLEARDIGRSLKACQNSACPEGHARRQCHGWSLRGTAIESPQFSSAHTTTAFATKMPCSVKKSKQLSPPRPQVLPTRPQELSESEEQEEQRTQDVESKNCLFHCPLPAWVLPR